MSNPTNPPGDAPPPPGDVDRPLTLRFLDDYFAEADEYLVAIRAALLELDRSKEGDADLRVLEELFRRFHSLKGISAMVELRDAETLAHQLESYLRALQQHPGQLTPEGYEALLNATRVLEEVIAARRVNDAPPDVSRAAAALAVVTEAAAATRSEEARTRPFVRPAAGEAGTGAARFWRVTFSPTPQLVERGVNVNAVRARLTSASRIVDVTPQISSDGGVVFEFLVAGDLDEATRAAWVQDGIVTEPVAGPAGAPLPPVPGPAPGVAHVAPSQFVRVDLTRLDELMRLVADIVISRARLEDTLAVVERHLPQAAWRAMQEHSQSIERQVRDLREAVMRVRLVPIGEIFQRMPFVVRDLAREMSRKARVQLEGEDTEIDKFLNERMMDPLVHLVRNAISHGIESPEERLAAGKPAEGRIRLSATALGESVVVEVEDDGRGVDMEAVVARARAAGMDVPPDPDGSTLLELICAAGLSTREEADRASGRGVGMAVVKKTVQDLGGTLSVDTVRGAGTRFVMRLPLTLAIVDALVATVDGHTFAVPQASVGEVIEVGRESIRRMENNEVVVHRNAPLPLIRLATVFGLSVPQGSREHVFVVGSGRQATGIAVDRIIGQREIVVRTISDPLIKVDGVSGATELGDGRVVLILDVPGVIRAHLARGAANAAAEARGQGHG